MIYLLEDDENIRKFVIYALSSTGIKAEGFELPSEFYSAVSRALPELVLLDIMLPQEDGLSVLKHIRSDSRTADLPVILLTARSGEYDKVLGLDSGADDYITKPFGTMELISRIRAVLRRSGSAETEISAGALVVNPEKHTVRADGKDVTLTRKEFELLYTLIKSPGTVFTRDRLLSDIWGYDYDGENRTVDVHIRTLREKLGSCGGLVETVRGTGYKIGENK